MRAVAATIAGVYALLLMSVALPRDEAECARIACEASEADATFLPFTFTMVMFAIPTVVVLVILRAVLGLRSTREPEAGAVLAALGQTRGAAMRRASRDALRDGAIAVGLAYAVAGGIHVAMLAGSDVNPFTTAAQAWAARLALGLLVMLTLLAAHLMAAAQRPRTPVAALTADMEADAPPRPSLRRRAMLSGAVLAISGGVIAGLAFSMRDTPWTDVSFVPKNAAGIAMITAWAGALALGLGAAVPWLRLRRHLATKAAAHLVGQNTAVGAVLASYAGDRSRASARIVTVLAGLGFLIAAVPTQVPTPTLSDVLAATVVVEGDVDGDPLEAKLRGIDGVDEVIAAPVARMEPDGAYTWVFGVDPDALRDHDNELASAIDRHPNAVAAPLWNGEVPMDVMWAPADGVEEFVPISTCCGAFVNAEHVVLRETGLGFLIFVEDGADYEKLRTAIDSATFSVPEATGMGVASALPGPSNSAFATAINIALAVVLLGLPLALLAVGAVRRRRRDDATLTALGASATTMRTAIAIDTAAVSAFALAGGMAIGAMTRILMTALQQGRLSLGPAVIDAPLVEGVEAVGWGAIGFVGLVSVAIMTTTALITTSATGRVPRTGTGSNPAEDHLTADKEGIR